MSDGWIKLHRKISEWEWYQNNNVFRVFLHLVLNANHKDKKWQGIEVKKGQIITGRKKLANELNCSEQSVRTALTSLKSTNEITIKTYNKYSIISITNWDNYQCQQPASQPSINQQLTTNKNDKNEKNKYIRQIEEIYASQYPRKLGKKKGIEKLSRQIKNDSDFRRLEKSIMNYKKAVFDQPQQYIKHFSSFAGCWEDYVDYKTEDDLIQEKLQSILKGTDE